MRSERLEVNELARIKIEIRRGPACWEFENVDAHFPGNVSNMKATEKRIFSL